LERNLQMDSVMTSIVAFEWKRLGAPNYICDNLLIFKHDTNI
jgi:hypothetical protein